MNLKKTCNPLSILALSLLSSSVFATAYPNISISEYSDMLPWDCQVSDNTNFSTKIDDERKLIIYQMTFSGNQVCHEEVSSEENIVPKCSGELYWESGDGYIYKKGIMIDGDYSNGTYQACRVPSSVFAYDSKTQTGHIDREEGDEE